MVYMCINIFVNYFPYSSDISIPFPIRNKFKKLKPSRHHTDSRLYQFAANAVYYVQHWVLDVQDHQQHSAQTASTTHRTQGGRWRHRQHSFPQREVLLQPTNTNSRHKKGTI